MVNKLHSTVEATALRLSTDRNQSIFFFGGGGGGGGYLKYFHISDIKLILQLSW